MHRRHKTNEAGFTLMELMIAAVIFLVVMAAVFGILQIGGILRDSISNSSETVNNARISINTAGRDAVNAGLGYSRVGGVVPDDLANSLLSIPADIDTDRDLFTAVMAGNEVSSSVLSVNGEKNDVVVFFYRDLTFNDGNAIVINGVNYTGAQIDLNTSTGACVVCRPYDLYLVESSNGNHALAMATSIENSNSTIRLAEGDPLGLNRRTDVAASARSILTPCGSGVTSDCFNYSPQGTLKKVFMISYSVNSQGTLVRTTYGNNTGAPAGEQIQEVPLAHNVQSFQVKYLLQDGTHTDDPSNGNVNQGDLNEVLQVEIAITIVPDQNRNPATTNQVIDLRSAFSTRNLKYDIE